MKKNILLKILIILNVAIAVSILTFIFAEQLFSNIKSIESIALIGVIITGLTVIISKVFFISIFKSDDMKKEYEADNLFN